MERLDLETINRATDLIRLCGGRLRKVAQSEGGEWAGPCPICGGIDRFHIQPYHQPQPRWLCRRCSGGSWLRPLDFVMASRGLSLGQAARWLNEFNRVSSVGIPPVRSPASASGAASLRGQSGSSPVGVPPLGSQPGNTPLGVPQVSTPPGSQPAAEPQKTPRLGSAVWQNNARQAIERSIEALWTSATANAAFDWLQGRGLTEAALRYFLIGWSDGIQQGIVYLPPGVVIPCMEGDTVWSIKIALLDGQMVRCEGCGQKTLARRLCARCGKLNKYRGVKGSHGGALFNADDLLVAQTSLSDSGEVLVRPTLRDVLFVEGEFDCMVAWQALRERVAVVTLGSAGGGLDMVYWADRLLRARRIYCLYDNDAAGERGRQKLNELTGGAVHALHLPQGFKDVNDFVLSGGNLAGWLDEQMQDVSV